MSDRNSENLGGNRGYSAISGFEVGREGSGGANASGGPVEWGPAIPVDGKRPAWLCDGEWRRVRSLAVGEWQTADVESPGDTIPDMNEWNWGDITAIRLPADHPYYRQTEAATGGDLKVSDAHVNASPIDWSGVLEAVHEDGRVVAVKVIGYEDGAGHHPSPDKQGDWYTNWPGEKRTGIWRPDGATWCNHLPDWRIRNVPQPTSESAGTNAFRMMDLSLDPNLIKARECVAAVYEKSGRADLAAQARDGLQDNRLRVQSALLAIKRAQPTPQADTKPDSDMGITISPDLTARMEALVRRMASADICSTQTDVVQQSIYDARVIVALLPKPVDPDLIEARRLVAEKFDGGTKSVNGDAVRAGARDHAHDVQLALAAIKRCRALALAGEKEA